MDPNTAIAWLTGGLVLFAAAQVGVAWRAECMRKKERALDERRDADLAYQSVWAEHVRLESLADQWDKSDLVELALLGLLRPDEVLGPAELSTIQFLARLSVEAGYLGGVAGTLAHDLARQIALLDASVQSIGSGANLKDRIGMAHSLLGQALEQRIDSIRTQTRQLSLLLWDALCHSPSASVERTLRFRDDLTSELGRTAVNAIAARARGKV